MKIDIGCGGRGTRFEGLIGLDVWPVPDGRTDYIQRDVAKDGLPFEDRTVTEAVCTHVLEHMPRPDGLKVLQEAWRVMDHGAHLYLSVPDMAKMARRYLDRDEEFYDQKYDNGNCIWEGNTLADKFLDSLIGMGEHGHKYGYDVASLKYIAREAGFTSAPSHDDCQYWTEDRMKYSVMIVCTKPFKDIV